MSQERREQITRMTFAQLAAALQSGDITAAQALHAYQAAALDVHAATNCLVEPVWEAEVKPPPGGQTGVGRRTVPKAGKGCVSICPRDYWFSHA